MDNRERLTLKRKATLLKESPLFVCLDNDDRLHFKQNIFLVLAGKKLVTQAYAGHWETEPSGVNVMRPDNAGDVARFLDELALNYAFLHDESTLYVTVARDAQTIVRFNTLEQQLPDTEAGSKTWQATTVAIGMMYGFPKTAAHGFAVGDKLSISTQNQIVKAAGLPPSLAGFLLSGSHYSEELAIIREWYELLEQYDLV